MVSPPVIPGGAAALQRIAAADVRPGATPAVVASPLPETRAPVLTDPAQQAVGAARAEAATRQAGLGSLLADLDMALASPALPPELRVAVRQVLSQQLPTDRPITADALRQAVAASGLFLEARIAQDAAPPLDLKGALLMLQQALVGASAKPPTRLQRPTAPPPVAGGSTAAQPPAEATLTGTEAPDDLLRHLRGDVEQALARQTLHQLASLPEGGGARWMFELPLATPQGPAVAQFAIEQDDPRASHALDAAPGWQARFSIHLEPLGPVHVRLRLDGERTHVTFWAETPEGLDRLRGDAAGLANALGAEIAFHAGAPPQVAAPSGQLVDRTS